MREITLPTANQDIACCQHIRANEEIETVSIFSLPSPKEIQTLTKTEGQQDFGLKYKKPKFLTKPSIYERFATSAVTSLDYGGRFLVRQVFEISRDADNFIERQRKAVQYRGDLLTISNKASEFLRKKGIEAKISIILFADPEYSDWVEPKIRIEVPKNEFEKAYDVYDSLLSYSLEGICNKTLRKLLVTIESQ